jgi:hypothetical protein
MRWVVENLKVSRSLLVAVIGTNCCPPSFILMFSTFYLGILFARSASLLVYAPPFPLVMACMVAAAVVGAMLRPLTGLFYPETSIVR